MANSISLITKYAAEALDKKFVQESATSILEDSSIPLRWVNAHTVEMPSITLSGLGDYSKTTGFPSGDVSWTWQSLSISKDRAKSFSIDAVDDEEAGNVFQYVSSEFLRTKVVPEVDAYRFSIIAGKAESAGTITTALTAANIITNFNIALKYFEDNAVPTDKCVWFVSTEVNQLLRNTTELTKYIRVDDKIENGVSTKIRYYENIPIVVVEPTRFKTAYTFGTDGFAAASGAVAINFMLINRDCTLPVKKHEAIRVFAPNQNIDADAYKFDYRLYHDIFVPTNKTAGVFLAKAAA